VTFSILACVPGPPGPAGALLGVATASRSLAVGHSVPAVLPGVGVMVSQSWTNPALRSEILDALERGAEPAEALAALPRLDAEYPLRQLGIVAASGAMASFTGVECSPWAGERRQETGTACVLAVGNLLTGPDVLDATVATLAAQLADGGSATDLAGLLVEALVAGQREGGDRRGQQSAAVVVAAGGDVRRPPDLDVDLRVDDHVDPLGELARLVDLRTTLGGLPLRPRTA